MTRPTRAQIESLARVYSREWSTKPASYRAFRRSAFIAFGNCLMVQFAGMWLGIERDGYTHS